MRALVLHGPGSYRFEADWPRPEPRPGWAVIRVRYAGVCGSDLPRFAVTGSYRHPMILGHEFSGTVETPAPGSRRFQKGDEVAVLPIIPCGECDGCRTTGEPFHCRNYQFIGSRNDGGYAELCAVPEQNLLRIPPEFGLRAGALIEPIVVALHAVRRSGFIPGRSALVLGAGAIGLLVGMWLRTLGASRVVVADIRPDSVERARSIGFEAFDPAGDGQPGSFDALFEAAGSARAIVSAVDWAADKAALTVVGRDLQDTVLPRATVEKLMRKELTLHGCWGYNLAGEEDLLMRTLRGGGIIASPLVSHEIRLERAAETIAAMIDRRFSYCKVLVRMDR